MTIKDTAEAWESGALGRDERYVEVVESSEPDGAERLCRALYGREPKAREYLGGSEAKMLHDAADRLEAMKAENTHLKSRLAAARNLLSMAVPHVDDADDEALFALINDHFRAATLNREYEHGKGERHD